MLVFPFIAVEPLAELATDGVALDEMEPDPASPIMSFIFPIFFFVRPSFRNGNGNSRILEGIYRALLADSFIARRTRNVSDSCTIINRNYHFIATVNASLPFFAFLPSAASAAISFLFPLLRTLVPVFFSPTVSRRNTRTFVTFN